MWEALPSSHDLVVSLKVTALSATFSLVQVSWHQASTGHSVRVRHSISCSWEINLGWRKGWVRGELRTGKEAGGGCPSDLDIRIRMELGSRGSLRLEFEIGLGLLVLG